MTSNTHNSLPVGTTVVVPEYAVPEDWPREGEIVEINPESVVVELRNGRRQELPTDDVAALVTDQHFTAWLVTDPSCLDQDNCDITVLQDAITGYKTAEDGTELPIWSTDIMVNPQYYATTRTPAADDFHQQAQQQATELLTSAGWSLAGPWASTPTGYIATVTRN